MRLVLLSFPIALGAACAPTSDTPVPPVDDVSAPTAAVEETPAQMLSGQWEIERIDNTLFPKQQGIVNFQSEEFFSHEAGCGGGHPAFYNAGLDGTFKTSRREAVVIGKCEGPRAAELERLLADFIDRADGWTMPAKDRLILT